MPKKSAKKASVQEHPLEKALIEHQPPHRLDAEKGVIGAILIDPRICDDIATIVRAEDFYSEPNKRLFKHLFDLYNSGSGIDITILLDRLEQVGDLVEVGGEAYIAQIMSDVHVTAYAPHYASIVRDKAILRDLIHTSAEILRSAYEPTLSPREIVNRSEEKIFALSDSRNSGQVSRMNDVVGEALGIINMRMEGKSDGIPTGFLDFDSITSGFHPNELIILAARPAMGKTALATNIADHVAVVEKIPTLMVSLEMGRTELAMRMICSRGRIDGHKLKGNFLSSAELQHLNKAASELSLAPLFIDDSPSRTVTEIGAVARRIKRQENSLGLIVIDYLGLIEPDNNTDPRQEQVAKMARRLKGLARELKVPILCLAQLNRQAETTKDNKPRLSHLRESGAIEQDADVVMFVHREEYYCSSREEAAQKDLIGKAELIVAKQRNGPTKDIKLSWFGQYTLFQNAAEDSGPNTYSEHTEFTGYSGLDDDSAF